MKKIGNLPKDEYEWFKENAAQTVVDKKNSSNLDETEAFDEEETQNNNLVLEKDAVNDYSSSEFHYQINTEDGINQIETESSNFTNPAKIPSTSHPKQSQVSSIQNEDAIENDWNPEVEPSEVEPSKTEDVIAEFKSSNLPTNRNIQSNSKSSASENENNENGKDLLSQAAKRKIGKWGEEFAIKRLREKFLGKYTNCKLQETRAGFDVLVNNQIKVEVNWLNKYGENGVGRDIEYVENGEKYFVEVKATKTDAKEIFQISRNEWQLAKGEQENYSIFRVYNAGIKQARCEEIRNPYKEWLEGKLSVQSLTVRI